MKPEINVSDVIARLGGTTAVAEIFGIEPPSVSEWKQRNHIPRARLMYLQLAHPHVFEGNEEAEGSSRASNGTSQSDTCTEKVA